MATDDFNRADGGLGSNWTDVQNGALELGSAALQIDTNQVTQSGTSVGYAWRNGSFDNDQYAEVTLVNPSGTGDQGAGVALRFSEDGVPVASGYDFTGKNDYGVIRKWIDGVRTILSNPGWSASGGDVIRGESEGSDLRIYLNDVEEAATTNGEVAAGNPGLALIDFSGAGFVDDWEGGDLGGGGGDTNAILINGDLLQPVLLGRLVM
jgi:hypothetical protein